MTDKDLLDKYTDLVKSKETMEGFYIDKLKQKQSKIKFLWFLVFFLSICLLAV